MFFAALTVSWKEKCFSRCQIISVKQLKLLEFYQVAEIQPLPIQTNVCSLAANRKTSAMCHVLCSKGMELGSLKADASFVVMTVMVI